MMVDLIDFFSFSDPNVRYVVLGTCLLSVSAAIVGAFIVLKQKALVGDAVAHSVLPGICMAFLFAGTKNTALMIVGAFLTGWLSLLAVDYIVAHSKIKKDAAIGLVLSVFFGVGIVLLTYIQQSGNAAQSGLDNFLFGNAAALIGTDLLLFSALSGVIVLTVLSVFKELTLVAFDPVFAQTMGLPVGRLELLLTTLTVLSVVAGITAVGVVLMAAMLITPAAAARYWADNIRHMIAIAAGFGVVSGLAGAFISYTAPAMPTGPWMVVVSSLIAFFSFLFAPRKGVVSKWYQQQRHKKQMQEENTLKLFYRLGELGDDFSGSYTVVELLHTKPGASVRQVGNSLRRLMLSGKLRRQQDTWGLTDKGRRHAAKVVRLHRLWELYLTQYVGIASDHVHENAETIEHVLTPELEQQLERQLGYPDKDPHETRIPR